MEKFGMLVRFAVENFFGIRDRQELSLVATASSKAGCAFPTGRTKPSHLLRVSAIFGPNASGKTTIIRAVNTLRRLVLRSHKAQRGETISGITPHLLGDSVRPSPSKFEIAFIAGGDLFEYFVSATDAKIVEEWLTRTRTSRRQLLFERTSAASTGANFYINPVLSGRHAAWTSETLDNMLLLSKIVSFNNPQLKTVYDWFDNVLEPPIFRTNTAMILNYSQKRFTKGDEAYRNSVMSILKALDLGVTGASVSEEEMNLDPEIKELFAPDVLKKLEQKEFVTKLRHRSKSGKEVEFPFDAESDGTQRLFALIGPLLLALREGGVLFVDELHNSLHPLATRFLVGLFQNLESNPKNSQLVFSTHDPTMLRAEVLHRDQIWFVERDRSQSSKLVALTEFKERSGVDYEDRYLKGRYGAIPHIFTMLTGLVATEQKPAKTMKRRSLANGEGATKTHKKASKLSKHLVRAT